MSSSKKYKLDQVSIRMVKERPLLSSKPIESPRDVVRLMSETFRHFDREIMAVVNFNNDLTPINMNIASMGSLNASLSHPRELMKSTILSNAAAVMLVHNHPSGNLTPSLEDILMTDRMTKLFSLIQIPMLDHVIVGNDDQVFSFKENHIMSTATPEMAVTVEQLHFDDFASKVEETSLQYAGTPASSKNKPIDQIMEKLETGVKDLFNSETFKEYLNTMSKFHNYSLNNTLLIAMQKPEATLVAGYQAWQKNHDRHVKKGEKGIQIIAPYTYKVKEETFVVDHKTGIPKMDLNGKAVTEMKDVEHIGFRVATVFDVSQTEGKDLPTLGVNELTGDVNGFDRMFEALKQTCPVPITYEDIPSGAKGYYHPAEKRIALQEGMSQIQTLKTLVHEMAHQKLHSNEIDKSEDERLSSRTKEVEAESVAYAVCQHYGIDTSEYSFGYIAGWSSGKETSELKESLSVIRDAASEMINDIDEKLMEMSHEKELAVFDRKPSLLQDLNSAKTSEMVKGEKPILPKSKEECL